MRRPDLCACKPLVLVSVRLLELRKCDKVSGRMKIEKRAEYTISLGDAELVLLINACDGAYRLNDEWSKDPLRTTEESNSGRVRAEKYRSLKGVLQNSRCG